MSQLSWACWCAWPRRWRAAPGRVARLLRDQRALSGAAADGIAGAIATALDELTSELGVKL